MGFPDRLDNIFNQLKRIHWFCARQDLVFKLWIDSRSFVTVHFTDYECKSVSIQSWIRIVCSSVRPQPPPPSPLLFLSPIDRLSEYAQVVMLTDNRTYWKNYEFMLRVGCVVLMFLTVTTGADMVHHTAKHQSPDGCLHCAISHRRRCSSSAGMCACVCVLATRKC